MPASPSTDLISDADLAAELSNEVLRGPRSFRGKPLATLTRGLRDLRNKLVAPDDSGLFHDAVLLYLLEAAHADKPEERALRRQALVLETDDAIAFRGMINLALDNFSDAEVIEADRLTKDILGIVEKAEVVIAEKKSEGSGLVVPSLTTTPSLSPPSSATPEAGAPNTSAGS